MIRLEFYKPDFHAKVGDLKVMLNKSIAYIILCSFLLCILNIHHSHNLIEIYKCFTNHKLEKTGEHLPRKQHHHNKQNEDKNCTVCQWTHISGTFQPSSQIIPSIYHLEESLPFFHDTFPLSLTFSLTNGNRAPPIS